MSRFDSLFEEAAAPAIDDVFGVSVVYRRGATTSSAFTATWEAVEYEVIDRDGFATRVASRDYYLKASDVVIASVTLEPRAGDQIEETINGTPRKFELMTIGKLPAVELQGDGVRWKVHTKQVV